MLDGIAESYFFKSDGYMVANAGYCGEWFNEKGQWIKNGVVQTKNLNEKAPEQDRSHYEIAVDSSKNTFNKYGCSNIALDMMKSTRAENDAKYGVAYAEEITSVVSHVFYTNGFYVIYADPSSGTYKSVGVSNGDASQLFKYYDPDISSPEEAEKYLLSKGIWTYGWNNNGEVASDRHACFVGVGTETIFWSRFDKDTYVMHLR